MDILLVWELIFLYNISIQTHLLGLLYTLTWPPNFRIMSVTLQILGNISIIVIFGIILPAQTPKTVLTNCTVTCLQPALKPEVLYLCTHGCHQKIQNGVVPIQYRSESKSQNLDLLLILFFSL